LNFAEDTVSNDWPESFFTKPLFSSSVRRELSMNCSGLAAFAPALSGEIQHGLQAGAVKSFIASDQHQLTINGKLQSVKIRWQVYL